MSSQDMTFCANDKCQRKRCERHPRNINWLVGPPWRSYSDFKGTRYCNGYIGPVEHNSLCETETYKVGDE